MREGHVHGPYLADRAGVEPTTFLLKVIDCTKAPLLLMLLFALLQLYFSMFSPPREE